LPDRGIALDAIKLPFGSGFLLFDSSQLLAFGTIYLFYRQINQVTHSSLFDALSKFGLYIDGITFSNIPQGLA
jgi:hypothetical protein